MNKLPNKFQHKIYRAVSECKTGALRWSEEGDSVIFNFPQFKIEYLGADDSISRSSSIPSFIRQLNLYGFRKLVDLTRENNCSEYANIYFQRGKPELLDFITRNNTQPKFMKNLKVKKEVLFDADNTNKGNELSKWKTSIQSRKCSSLKQTLDTEDKEKFDLRASLAETVKTRKRKCVLKNATGSQREEQIHVGDEVPKKRNKPITVKSAFNMQHRPVNLKNGDNFLKKAQQTGLDMQYKLPVLNETTVSSKSKASFPVQHKPFFLKRNEAPKVTENSIVALKPPNQIGNNFMISTQPAADKKKQKHQVLNGYSVPMTTENPGMQYKATIYSNSENTQDVIYIGKFQSSVPKSRQNSNMVVIKHEPEDVTSYRPEFQNSQLVQALNASRTTLSNSEVNSHDSRTTDKTNQAVNPCNYSSNLKDRAILEDVKYIGMFQRYVPNSRQKSNMIVIKHEPEPVASPQSGFQNSQPEQALSSAKTSLLKSEVNSHDSRTTAKTNREVNSYKYSSNLKDESILEDVKGIRMYQHSALVCPVLGKIKQEPKKDQAGKVLQATPQKITTPARIWHIQPYGAAAEAGKRLELKLTPNSVLGEENTRSPLVGEKSPTGLKWLSIKEEKDSVPPNRPCTEIADCRKKKLTIPEGTPVKPNIISKASKRSIVKNIAKEFSTTHIVSNEPSLKENDSSKNADDLILTKKHDTSSTPNLLKDTVTLVKDARINKIYADETRESTLPDKQSRKRKPSDEDFYMYEENPLMQNDDPKVAKRRMMHKTTNVRHTSLPEKAYSVSQTIISCSMEDVIHRHDCEYSESFHDVFTDWYKPNRMLAQAFYEHLQGYV
ncbi:uncharacterized protein LOC118193530 isoform X2 [Stegodyphus dumicola]|uniref:uncharacterized protein LOC118193530 isoform X2 n=1 Tax=Stegodyphus dumicola TaxID=202533 RepID=UPI0015B1EF2E|nr:uncharacterized protein LOC118193530 isoform X2 [Stegodyphus dumicola]